MILVIFLSVYKCIVHSTVITSPVIVLPPYHSSAVYTGASAYGCTQVKVVDKYLNKDQPLLKTTS